MKTWLPLCLALVLGLVAAKVAKDMIAKNKGSGGGANGTVQVVVARRQINPGEMLNAENLTMGSVGQDNVPETSYKSIADLNERVAETIITKGQPVVEPVLAAKGAGYGIEALIPNGMRAITIEVNEFSGVGGMLVPGCRIDMIATVQGENGEMTSRTIVQNLTIRSVGQQIVVQPKQQGGEPTVFRSVTLLATPDETEIIELAAATGRPRLVLRGGNDKVKVPTNGITVAELRKSNTRRATDPFVQPAELISKNPSLPQSRTNWERVIKIIRGGVESEVKLDGPIEANPKKQENKPAADKGVTQTDPTAPVEKH